MRHPTAMDGLVSLEPRMAGSDLGAVGGSAHPQAMDGQVSL
ncbi:hypothetical protein DSOL_0422 [Desulfosporosinus metallidurans]|uniref:Uncharacterized protein n=1 Tax=Desulfosporosinus metallidurans TaxID=1888891 RepID=A0A1Q8R286_9FIRM|nr:hypothetical protein DSOL_0422 [Desulfosporosinus metallidurans]